MLMSLESKEKNGGRPSFSSSKEKTLDDGLSVGNVSSARCANHMCKIYLLMSFYLSLFVFCEGK